MAIDLLKSPHHYVASETFGLPDLPYDSNLGLTVLEPGLQVLPLQLSQSFGEHEENSEAVLRTRTQNR